MAPLARTFVTLSIAGLLASAACSASRSTQGPVVIGAKGGTVTSSDGAATLTIPPGALATDVSITINAAIGAPPGFLGQAYDIEPSGTQFKRPVAVAFQYQSAFGSPSTLEVGTVNEGGDWVALPLSVASTTNVQGSTMHLSYYGVLPSPSCTTNNDCESPFDCVAGTCAIPCRTTMDCPPPYACGSGQCGPLACAVDTDCSAIAGASASGYACVLPGVCANVSDQAAVTASEAAGVISCVPYDDGTPLTAGAGCPGEETPACDICQVLPCPVYDQYGETVHNCDGFCAYGYCWPLGTGCTCGTSGCNCSAEDAGAVDAGHDAGRDAGHDAGRDATSADASRDSGHEEAGRD
jgi:hypothetical protein